MGGGFLPGTSQRCVHTLLINSVQLISNSVHVALSQCVFAASQQITQGHYSDITVKMLHMETSLSK